MKTQHGFLKMVTLALAVGILPALCAQEEPAQDERVTRILERIERRISEVHRQLLAELEEMIREALEEEAVTKAPDGPFAQVAGVWDMTTDLDGMDIPATLTLSVKDGKLEGLWQSQGRDMKLTGLVYEAPKLRFKRSLRQGMDLSFAGTIRDGKLTGIYSTPFGELGSRGTRQGAKPTATPAPKPEQPAEEKTEQVEKSAESPPDKKVAPFAALIGDWEMEMDVNGSTREATLSLSVKDDQLSGLWRGRRRESELTKLILEGNRLTFERSMGEGRTWSFSGTVDGDRITGTYSTPFGEISCTGKRVKKKKPSNLNSARP